MTDKDVKELSVTNEELPAQTRASNHPNYDHLFKKHGVLDGKMFYTSDKVTYTFVDNDEVISLHFDINRKTIFYKGHNISNVELTPLQCQHLIQFKNELEKHGETGSFVLAYSNLLEKYIPKI